MASSVSGVTRLGDTTSYDTSQETFRRVSSHEGRVVFFATELPPGTYEVEYVMVAVFPGSYTALPAMARGVYLADTVARTATTTVVVMSNQDDR